MFQKSLNCLILVPNTDIHSNEMEAKSKNVKELTVFILIFHLAPGRLNYIPDSMYTCGKLVLWFHDMLSL